MVDKKGFTLGELRSATKEADDSIDVQVNGGKVTDVLLQRDDAGTLYVNVIAPATLPTTAADPPLVPTPEASMAPAGLRRDTDDSQLTDESQPDEVAEADVAAAASMKERRRNDPASLTEEERAELKRLEELGGVTEQRTLPTDDGEDEPL